MSPSESRDQFTALPFSFRQPLGYRRFQIGSIFVKSNLFKPTIYIHNFMHIDFHVNLKQFHINFSRLLWV